MSGAPQALMALAEFVHPTGSAALGDGRRTVRARAIGLRAVPRDDWCRSSAAGPRAPEPAPRPSGARAAKEGERSAAEPLPDDGRSGAGDADTRNVLKVAHRLVPAL